MEVYLIRHGRTQWNAEHRYLGRTDVPLSEKGRTQVIAAGQDASVTTVAVSPLSRTRQTAALLFPRAKLLPYAGLIEMDFGDFEGRTADEMEADAHYRNWVLSDCTLPCPNGESMEQLKERALASFYQAVRDAEMRGETRLFMVTHGGVILSLLHALVEPDGTPFSWSVGNVGGYRLTLAKDFLNTPRIEAHERIERFQFG